MQKALQRAMVVGYGGQRKQRRVFFLGNDTGKSHLYGTGALNDKGTDIACFVGACAMSMKKTPPSIASA